MRKIISSPGRYIQGEGELANLSADYKELALLPIAKKVTQKILIFEKD